jgi:Fe-S cluster biosynthesis and repair protein YggX
MGENMSEVTCARCGNTAKGLDAPPFPGPLGEKVRDRVCAHCWSDWMGMQVKVINEYRLSPVQPEHFELLMAQLRAFLNLDD